MKRLYQDIRAFIGKVSPVKIVVLGYLFYVIAGYIFLSLPICKRDIVSSIDTLFVATSAMSTTGLVPITVSEKYNFLGQFIIMTLIQLGGIGYMTVGSFVILSAKRTITTRAREISQSVYSLPENFNIESFIVHVISFTFVIELIGAIALYFPFKAAGVENSLWQAIFHSVSAFCTAGFSLFPDGLMGFRNDFWVNVIISVLSILGAIGFIVFVDVWKTMRGYQSKITLTSKIILATTGWMLVIGTILVFLTEEYEQAHDAYQRILYSFFQVTAAMSTAGFNTIDITVLTKSTLMLLIIYMIIGASPSGTGGGMKTTTFSVMIGCIKSGLRGRKEITFWNAVIPDYRVKTAIASLCFYFATYFVGTYLLALTEDKDLLTIAFESASALGTVGLSMNFTSSLSEMGKILITILMFLGRVGPLSFGIALFASKPILELDSKNHNLAV